MDEEYGVKSVCGWRVYGVESIWVKSVWGEECMWVEGVWSGECMWVESEWVEKCLESVWRVEESVCGRRVNGVKSVGRVYGVEILYGSRENRVESV